MSNFRKDKWEFINEMMKEIERSPRFSVDLFKDTESANNFHSILFDYLNTKLELFSAQHTICKGVIKDRDGTPKEFKEYLDSKASRVIMEIVEGREEYLYKSVEEISDTSIYGLKETTICLMAVKLNTRVIG